MAFQTNILFKEINDFILRLPEIKIPTERQKKLNLLTKYIFNKIATQQTANLIFICTHNSRRSHLAQIWAQTFAYYFKIPQVYCYSGGTEVSAISPLILQTLTASGFQSQQLSTAKNSLFALKYSQNDLPILAFSKQYDAFYNPQSAFCAIMTCSQADEGCPLVAGAEKRIALTYEDPKIFDNTAIEKQKYEERNLQIAAELYFVFSQIPTKK